MRIQFKGQKYEKKLKFQYLFEFEYCMYLKKKRFDQ